ncbi:Protein saf4 [Knufia obscura]|uniref:Protein saf4 n=1 Tax=Knufia obscura TaxID=1635080 RepID=A0ABR0S098_9EURO|nr:Protein saf4 [Knufia obscura]
MQGFNMGRYIPPELEGLKSFNQASGKKPIKRSADGAQTVRFECPFAIWCTNCRPEQIIGQGVRFNAEKKKVGNYHSTPIWSFRIKHTLCGGWIEVQTDPKNTEYVVVSGGRRRDDGRDKVLEGEVLIGQSEAEKAVVQADGAFGSLEKKARDKEVADTQKVRVEELKKRSERDWADPYEMNKRIRREFRVGRRQRQDNEKTGEALQEKFGLGMDMAAPAVEDGERAKLIDFGESKHGSMADTGIFEAKTTPMKVLEKDKGKRGKKLDVVAQQKRALQTNLKGNTRAKSDPFLRHEQPWEPAVRKRKEERPMFEPTMIAKTKSTTDTVTLVAYDSD